MPQIDNYYNRFSEAKHYEEMLFRDGYGMQASEMNEMQSIEDARITKLARALFADGDVINGGSVKINAANGRVEATAAEIFAAGRIWTVPAANFTIPKTGTVAIGIFLTEQIISEHEDTGLRNPALGFSTTGEAGAWRKKITAAWGYASSNTANFYAVYEAVNCILNVKEAPPNLEAFNLAIARYDRDSTGGGTYICNGMLVAAENVSDLTRQYFTVGAGRARVNGAGIEVHAGMRLPYNTGPNLREIDTEVISATGAASQTVKVAHPPVWQYDNLRVTRRKTVSIVHGNYLGCTDALPDTSVLQIISVVQSGTTYAAGTSYNRVGDTLDWSLSGPEPAAGSTYQVTYDYLLSHVAPVSPTKDGFVVQNAVAGSSIMISYKQALPRIDCLCVSDLGEFRFLQGPANEYGARPPQIPASLLKICSISQDWRKAPTVSNDGVRCVSFGRMAEWQEMIYWCVNEVARNRLEMDASTREAGTKVGMFVDPLLDDTMRDQGISQTGAVFDGCLTLAIDAVVLRPGADIKKARCAAYSVAELFSQPLATGGMKVNPYMAFAIPEGKATINPSVDRWTEEQTVWASTITQKFYTSENRTVAGQTVNRYRASSRATGVLLGTSESTSSSSETSTRQETVIDDLGTKTSAVAVLRQITISFTLEGFGPGEILQAINFGGVNVALPANRTAGSDGTLTGSFTIPANVPAGSKQVEFRGSASVAYATFVGQGTLAVRTLRKIQNVYSHTVNTTTVTTTRIISSDPLAQTFTVEQDVMLTGVDLWFRARGTTNAQVQIREVENGYPTSVVLAEALIRPAAQVVNGGQTRCQFDYPLPLEAGVEYAIVILCNDAITELAIAEMGKFDSTRQQWVTAQPYVVGVLLSSSNAKTWTAHQDADLKFRLLRASFTATSANISLGTVALPAGTTDILLTGAAELPGASCWHDYALVLPSGRGTLALSDGQSVSLAAAVSGNASLTARLHGDSDFSPILWSGTQIIAGKLRSSGDYVSRSIVTTDANRAVLIFDAWQPSGSTITAQIQIDSGSWQNMTLAGTTPQDNGVIERRYEKALSGAAKVKIKLTLAGSAAARPCVYDIRLIAVK